MLSVLGWTDELRESFLATVRMTKMKAIETSFLPEDLRAVWQLNRGGAHPEDYLHFIEIDSSGVSAAKKWAVPKAQCACFPMRRRVYQAAGKR